MPVARWRSDYQPRGAGDARPWMALSPAAAAPWRTSNRCDRMADKGIACSSTTGALRPFRSRHRGDTSDTRPGR